MTTELSSSSRFKEITLTWDNERVSQIVIEDSEGDWYTLVYGDVSPGWSAVTTPSNLKTLRDIYATDEGLRTNDNPAVATEIILEGCPYTDDYTQLEDLGYVNPLDNESNARVIARKRSMFSGNTGPANMRIYGPVYRRTNSSTRPATPADDSGTIGITTGLTVAPADWSLTQLQPTEAEKYVYVSFVYLEGTTWTWTNPILSAEYGTTSESNVKGAWDATVTYKRGDIIVSHGTLCILSPETSLNQSPESNPAIWVRIRNDAVPWLAASTYTFGEHVNQHGKLYVLTVATTTGIDPSLATQTSWAQIGTSTNEGILTRSATEISSRDEYELDPDVNTLILAAANVPTTTAGRFDDRVRFTVAEINDSESTVVWFPIADLDGLTASDTYSEDNSLLLYEHGTNGTFRALKIANGNLVIRKTAGTGTTEFEVYIDHIYFVESMDRIQEALRDIVGSTSSNIRGAWDSATTYNRGDIVLHSNVLWIQYGAATRQSSASPNADPLNWYQLGRVQDWTSGHVYRAGAIVLGTDDNVYICVRDANTSTNPTTNTEQWVMLDPNRPGLTWNSTRTYRRGNVVHSGSHLWMCLATTSTGTNPTGNSQTDWVEIGGSSGEANNLPNPPAHETAAKKYVLQVPANSGDETWVVETPHQNIPDSRLLPTSKGHLGQVLTETSATVNSALAWRNPFKSFPPASGQFGVYRRHSSDLTNVTDLPSGRIHFYKSSSTGGTEGTDREQLTSWNHILGSSPDKLGPLNNDKNNFMILHKTENRGKDHRAFYTVFGQNYWTYPAQFLLFVDFDQWILYSGNLIGNSATVWENHFNFRLERVLAFDLSGADGNSYDSGIPFDIQIKWGFQGDNDTVLAQRIEHTRFLLGGANQPTLPTLGGWNGSAFTTGNANQTTEAPPAQDESTSTHLWLFSAVSTRTAGPGGTWSTTAWSARRATDPDSTTFSAQYSFTGTGGWTSNRAGIGNHGYMRFRLDSGEWFGPVWYGPLPEPPELEVEYSATETGTYSSTVRTEGWFRWKLSTETTWAGPFRIPTESTPGVTIPTLDVQYSATETGTFTSTVLTDGFYRFRYNNGPWIGPAEIGATQVTIPEPVPLNWVRMFAYHMPIPTSSIVHNLVAVNNLDDYTEIEFRTYRTGTDGALGTHRMRIADIPVTNYTPSNLTPTGTPVKLTHNRDGLQVSVGSDQTESGSGNGRSVGLVYFQRSSGVTTGRIVGRIWHRGLQISDASELHTEAWVR